MFVDIDGRSLTAYELVAMFQELPHKLTSTSYLLLRWPDITSSATPESEAALDAQAAQLGEAIAAESRAVGYGQLFTGVVRFRIGRAPSVVWAGGTDASVPISDQEILQRALQVELQALLDWGHAIWRPTSYHYELPSGEHAGAFIRVGDAFRTPRDVRVISSWISAQLRDGLAIVADSATLVPLVTDLQALIASAGWTSGRVEMLDEYPRTRLDLARVIQPLHAAAGGVLGIVSVSASGRYRDLMHEAIASSARLGDRSWSMIVLVDKQADSADRRYIAMPTYDDPRRLATWVTVPDHDLNPLDEASCKWCRSNARAQLVRIDPRTFEALALPGHALLTPDVTRARESIGIWQSCYGSKAIGVDVRPEQRSPSVVSRPKNGLMAVRVDFNKLLSEEPHTLFAEIDKRLETLRKEEAAKPPSAARFDFGTAEHRPYDGVLVSEYDASRPGFKPLFDHVMRLIGMAGAEPTLVSPPADQSPAIAPAVVAKWRKALIFGLGSVTGWNLRQLQLAAEDQWTGQHGRELSGLVIHARPESSRDWESIGRAFRNQLRALWLTYLPGRSPIAEEAAHLGSVRTEDLSLSERAAKFLEQRRLYTAQRLDDDWEDRCEAYRLGEGGPDPYAIFWGMSSGGSLHVRTQSNFGYEVDALTAYAGMGAAMHSARQRAVADDPRFRVFEMPAISRAYYDGILLAAVLRWCEPQETWWGQDEREAANVARELLARTVNEGDQKVLFPELLLAASQGKVPTQAVAVLVAEIPAVADRWGEDERAPVDLALALLRSSSLRPLDD